MAQDTVHAFIERLADDEAFRKETGPALAAVTEGDWDNIVAIAAQAGYAFSKTDLIKAVPDNFFRGSGTHPETGWSRSTLKQ